MTENQLLSMGSRGSDVKFAQELLMEAGYILSSFGPDGIYGDETFEKVSKLQNDHGIPATGVIDRRTWGILKKYEGG